MAWIQGPKINFPVRPILFRRNAHRRHQHRDRPKKEFGMLLRFYSFVVLIYDVIFLAFMVVKSFIEAAYHLISPPASRPVGDDIVLIAGTARGLGKALAIRFASLGSKVVCWDIRDEDNATTVQEANKAGDGVGRAFAYHCDITNRDKVFEVASQVGREVGDVTIIINCCNLPSPRSLIQRPAPEVQATLKIGVMSHFWILQAFLPLMQEKKRGHVVMLSSVAGLTGAKDLVPLSTAQFAVQGLAESLHEELRQYKPTSDIKLTLVHIYPFVVTKELEENTIQLRIPSYFGTIEPDKAAKQIIDAVQRGYTEVSIPSYLLYVGKLVGLLPRKAVGAIRELLDTGVDFG